MWPLRLSGKPVYVSIPVTPYKEAGPLFLSAPVEEAWPVYMSVSLCSVI